MFKKKSCEICNKEIGFIKYKYKGGYLCLSCHNNYYTVHKGLLLSTSNISIEDVKQALNEKDKAMELWNSDIDMFDKNYSNTFFVDEVNDRIIVNGIQHKFNISSILKFELVEQGTSSEVKELYIQILTSDSIHNYVKVRVVKAPLNSTYKKTEWTYRPYIQKAQQLIADLEVIKANYEAKKESYTNKITENISGSNPDNKAKFCTECGSPIVVGNKFCGECGNKL